MQEVEVSESQSVVDRYRKLKSEADKFLEDAKADALKRTKDAIADLNSLGFANFTLANSEAPPAKRTRKATTLPPKYVNPADPTQTWSGRGKKASWLQELVEKGTNQEEFLNPART